MNPDDLPGSRPQHTSDMHPILKFQGSGMSKTVQSSVDRTQTGAQCDRILGEDSRRKREGTLRPDMMLTDQDQVDLAHQLTIDTLAKIFVRHGIQGPKMRIACRTDQRVERSRLFKKAFS
jgi:hypothetical protein